MTDPTYRVDPDLHQSERETYILFAADDDRAHVHTDNPHILRRLRALDHWEEDRVYRSDGEVYGGEGTVPVGALKVRDTVRTTGGHGQVIGEPSEDDD